MQRRMGRISACAWVALLSASLLFAPQAFAQLPPLDAGPTEPAAEESSAAGETGETAEAEADPADAPAVPLAEEGDASAASPSPADDAAPQEPSPLLVPEQLGETGAREAAANEPWEADSAEAQKPGFLESVPWWAWALGAAAVLVLAASQSGGGGGGGSNDDDSGEGTVGYSW